MRLLSASPASTASPARPCSDPHLTSPVLASGLRCVAATSALPPVLFPVQPILYCNTMRLNLKKFKCLYQPFAHTTSGASELFHPVLQIVHQGICLYKRERVVWKNQDFR
ncbi:hypothetical protein EJB05_50380, partial [Eragrostis curvula]